MEFLNPSYRSSPIRFHGFDSNRELEKVPAAESAPAPAPEVAPAAEPAPAPEAAAPAAPAAPATPAAPAKEMISIPAAAPASEQKVGVLRACGDNRVA